MKVSRFEGRAGAFTLLELLSVMAVLIVLAALLLPALRSVRAQAKRAQCVSRLRQIGVGFQNFAHDHNGQFPMTLPARAGGTLEFAASGRRLAGDFYFSFRHLQALSNELVTPKLLVCPSDSRQPGLVFSMLQNSNLSYFVAINASYAQPDSILSGDRNVTNDWAGAPSLVRLGGNYSLRWTHELHRFKGNLLFSDGRVEEKNSTVLMAASGQAPPIAELALPTAQSPAFPPAHGSGAPVITRPSPTVSPGTLLATFSDRASSMSTAEARRADVAEEPYVKALTPTANAAPEATDPSALAMPGSASEARSDPAGTPPIQPSAPSFLPLWAASAVQKLTGKTAWLIFALVLIIGAAALGLRRWAGRTERKPRRIIYGIGR